MKNIYIGFILILLLSGCDDNSSDTQLGAKNAKECIEPQNPYDEGSGHYAGFKWAEEEGSGDCEGNSESFTEGCDEYEQQLDEYEACVNGEDKDE